MDRVIFIDTEVNPVSGNIVDYGAALDKDTKIHTGSGEKFAHFLKLYGSDNKLYLCGHNIIRHDLKYLEKSNLDILPHKNIDTLFWSALLFPCKPYHALLKDDKLKTEELNNPLNDSIKAMELYYDEVNEFWNLDDELRSIYVDLLYSKEEFHGFLSVQNCRPKEDIEGISYIKMLAEKIKTYFKGKICDNAYLDSFISRNPVELGYVLALISARDTLSIFPFWVNRNYPIVNSIFRYLCGTPCKWRCEYCIKNLNIRTELSNIFGYRDFRKYDGEKLQESAVQAAVENKSLLAVFPTGGGKSITFQLPALIAAKRYRALTVVISPLQSLMKDQVDNLEDKGILSAVTINGMLSPIERAEALERVESGMASMLYISPESLRSATVEGLLIKRPVARFVIDEAHCFSAWGQDFRVDYLYIGDFIKKLEEIKKCKIPISCFTATAKQKVISDIRTYFKEKTDTDLNLFTSNAVRKNLRYEVIHVEEQAKKYVILRWLLAQKNCPAIVYVSKIRRTQDIAKQLCDDGFKALPYNGKMDRNEKQDNQDAFKNDEVQVIVATSAFGMGVDKANVKLVVHYDISDSLENYVQEAGRAGRDETLDAECYVLYNEDDLNEHFEKLNKNKLSISEIQQVWKAVKDLTKKKPVFQRTPLEIARKAGWDENIYDVETRVKTAINSLEEAGYLKRGKNCPRIFATSILVKNMPEAAERIERSSKITKEDKHKARRIMGRLISAKNTVKEEDYGESRVDYIADSLGIEREEVFRLINFLREEKILSDDKDMTAYIYDDDNENRALNIVKKYEEAEKYLVGNADIEGQYFNLKKLNDGAVNSGLKKCTVSMLKTILYYWTIRKYIKKESFDSSDKTVFVPEISIKELWEKREKEISAARYLVSYLYNKKQEAKSEGKQDLVGFSILELKEAYEEKTGKFIEDKEIESALLYLVKIDAMKIEGGFLVLYNGMSIKRLEMDNKIRYKVDDYHTLNEYYMQKIQQIHIVGKYANMMLGNYNEALEFVNDYFHMDYKIFLSKYFKGRHSGEINRNITPERYDKLFKELTEVQRKIIEDGSQYIVVSAGPGSGKTKVLVHKLASLMLLEDVKQEQLLMLTFSRAAAVEFQQRLRKLIGKSACFVEIKTFHSYCFDLLGRIGDLNNANTVVEDAIKMIREGDVESGKITKTVLVIDEAQDMDDKEFELIKVLIEKNEGLRVIAVGDDDQNIYEWRGSSSKYFQSFLEYENCRQYELLDNYRSSRRIVAYANLFAKHINNRMKANPIVSKRPEDGVVEFLKCSSSNLEIPVVNKAMELNAEDTVCILTIRNVEADRVVGLLKGRKVKAKLIQSNEKFDIYDMEEIRFFMNKIEEKLVSPIIEDSIWENAKSEIKRIFINSTNLEVCLNLLNAFEKGNIKKYKSDFEIFLHESRLEDFYMADKHEIVVSTIHKSKGREFDNVILLINSLYSMTDKDKRSLYVGMTRAKKNLFIVYNQGIFDQYICDGFNVRKDMVSYGRPSDIMMQMGHKDVVLDFFKDKKDIIGKMQGGTGLIVDKAYLCIRYRNQLYRVAKFSEAFKKKIENAEADGYKAYKSVVRFVVRWRDGQGEEYPIILPELYLRDEKHV